MRCIKYISQEKQRNNNKTCKKIKHKKSTTHTYAQASRHLITKYMHMTDINKPTGRFLLQYSMQPQ